MTVESLEARKARRVDAFRDNLNRTSKPDVTDWFDDVDDFQIEEDSLEKLTLRVVKFTKRKRWGIYYNDKSFSFPFGLEEVSVIKQVLDDLSTRCTFEESDDLATPRLISSNQLLMKKLESLGYSVVSPVINGMAKIYTPKQLSLLTDYLYSNLLKTKGIERLDLKLKTNTNYFKTKAKKLAELQGGVGSWSLLTVRYHANDIAYCSLGHKLKWEFIVEESVTKERISFGAYCVEDFFDVDDSVRGQIVSHRNALMSKLLDYALQLTTSKKYAFHIDAWVSAFTLDAVQYSKQFEKVHSQYLEFVKNRVLVPQELSNELIKHYPFEEYQKIQGKLNNLLGDEYKAVSALGIFGNQLLDYSDNGYFYSQGEKHFAGTLNLYGLMMLDDALIRENLSKYSYLSYLKGWVKYLPKTVKTLRGITSYEGYFNISNKIATLQRSLTLLQMGSHFEINSSFGKVKSIRYKGVDVFTDDLTITDLLGYLSNSDFDLFSTVTMPKLGLNFSKFPEDLKKTLTELRNLFLDKNTVNGRVEVRPLKKYDFNSELGKLINLGEKKMVTLPVLNSCMVGSLKDYVLQSYLEEKLGVTGKSLVETDKEITGKFIISGEGILPWSATGTSLQTIGILSKTLDEMKVKDFKKYDFPSRILQTVLNKPFVSGKQLVYLDRAVNNLRSESEETLRTLTTHDELQAIL